MARETAECEYIYNFQIYCPLALCKGFTGLGLYKKHMRACFPTARPADLDISQAEQYILGNFNLHFSHYTFFFTFQSLFCFCFCFVI